MLPRRRAPQSTKCWKIPSSWRRRRQPWRPRRRRRRLCPSPTERYPVRASQAAACRPAAGPRAARPSGRAAPPATTTRRTSGHAIAQVDDEWKNDRAYQCDAGDDQEHARRHALHAIRRDPAAQEAPEAGAQQQREQRHGQRVDRMSKQQNEALEQCDLEQHEAGAEGAEVDRANDPTRAPGGALISSGPRMNTTTSRR